MNVLQPEIRIFFGGDGEVMYHTALFKSPCHVELWVNWAFNNLHDCPESSFANSF